MAKNEIERTKASDFNLIRLNPNELKDHVKCSVQSHGNIAIFGRRGTGKTMIAKQAIAESSGFKEVYLNLSVLERVDLGGYPDMLSATKSADSADSKNEKAVRFLNFILPSFYRSLLEGNEKVALLLDEVDKADPSLWAPLLEITQFHSCNGMKLPNLASCIMTGNLAAEGGQRPSLPLLDRAEKYLAESNAQQWLDWAGRSNEIHPSITAYINDHADDLYGEVDEGDNYASASPRGWHNASKLLHFGEKNGWNPNILVSKVSGCIGKQIGLKFKAYYDHYQVLLPLVDKVFEGKPVTKDFAKLKPTEQIVAAMIVCARFAGMIDKHKELLASKNNKNVPPHPKESQIVANFLLSIDVEIALIAARSQINIYRIIELDLQNEPGWDDLLVKINSRLGTSKK